MEENRPQETQDTQITEISPPETPPAAEDSAPLVPAASAFDWSKLLVPGAIIVSGFMISVAVIFAGGFKDNTANLGNQLDPNRVVDVSADDDPFLGNPDAKVVLIEFSDFQCPYCRKFWRETLPSIKKEYIDTGKIKFVYRDLPLSIHPGALPAAMASHCAQDQGKYWEYHDKMFAEQDKQGQNTVEFGSAELKSWAREIGLNGDEFDACLDSQKYFEEVNKDSQEGFAAGVEGTPTTFVNGRPVVGALSFETFQTLIENELNK